MSDNPNQLGPRWPTIPDTLPDSMSLYNSVSRLKEAMELLTGQRDYSEDYSVDKRFETVTKTVNNISATYSRNFQLVVNQYGALAQRTELIEAEITAARDGEPNLNARIVSVDTASVDRDGALATSIDLVEASVNDVSAGGFFKTTAAVSGVVLAEMEARVYTTTAQNVSISAGWRVKVEGGVGYFDIFTDRFRLIDNVGVPRPVLVYSGGKFLFTGDVAVDGSLVINGTVVTDKVAPAAISQMGADASAGTPAVVLGLRAGARVVMLGTWTGDPGAINLYPATATGAINFYINGGLAFSQLCGFFQDVPGNPSFTYRAPLPTTYQFIYVVPAAGTYTFQMDNHWNGATNPTGANYLSIIELAR